MKALSVRNPWAYLIIHGCNLGHKDVENRTWRTRHRGLLAIHASKTFDAESYWQLLREGVELPDIVDFQYGGIIGTVELVDCVARSESRWFEGPYGFVLEDPRACKFVPLRGYVGLFEVSDDLVLIPIGRRRELMIWTWLKDGCPRGFFKDERSLLISYDMIPLRGLPETREALNQKGEIAVGYLIEDKGNSLFVPFKDGHADIEAIDWGCRGNTYGRCLRSLCYFVSFSPGEWRCNKFSIPNEDNIILREFHWRASSNDKRRRRPLTRLEPMVEAILFGLGFQIKSVIFLREDPSCD